MFALFKFKPKQFKAFFFYNSWILNAFDRQPQLHLGLWDHPLSQLFREYWETLHIEKPTHKQTANELEASFASIKGVYEQFYSNASASLRLLCGACSKAIAMANLPKLNLNIFLTLEHIICSYKINLMLIMVSF